MYNTRASKVILTIGIHAVICLLPSFHVNHSKLEVDRALRTIHDGYGCGIHELLSLTTYVHTYKITSLITTISMCLMNATIQDLHVQNKLVFRDEAYVHYYVYKSM